MIVRMVGDKQLKNLSLYFPTCLKQPQGGRGGQHMQKGSQSHLSLAGSLSPHIHTAHTLTAAAHHTHAQHTLSPHHHCHPNTSYTTPHYPCTHTIHTTHAHTANPATATHTHRQHTALSHT
ncbi:hypothetical protein CsSME_00024151 [Camellia sinensis var. sinensis]